jgi:hypothetical protein
MRIGLRGRCFVFPVAIVCDSPGLAYDDSKRWPDVMRLTLRGRGRLIREGESLVEGECIHVRWMLLPDSAIRDGSIRPEECWRACGMLSQPCSA